jgi:predicted AAA+ superfamily ATPase
MSSPRAATVLVDTDQRPGQFLLTGSAQVLALRELPNAFPGRMEIVELWPFSQGELERSPEAFVYAAFVRGPGLSRNSTLRKRDYLDRIVRGGSPEAIRRSPRRRAAFFDSYLTNRIERDVKELAAIERRGDFRRLLALLAGHSGRLLVPATLAAASGIPRTTLNRYLELLSAVFLTKQIPAWSTGQSQRAIGAPKLAFVDTGIAAHLLGQDTRPPQ